MLEFLKKEPEEIQRLFKRIASDHFSSVTTTPKNRETNIKRLIDELAKELVRKKEKLENVD